MSTTGRYSSHVDSGIFEFSTAELSIETDKALPIAMPMAWTRPPPRVAIPVNNLNTLRCLNNEQTDCAWLITA